MGAEAITYRKEEKALPEQVEVLIIGGGLSGLALHNRLTPLGVDSVVLDQRLPDEAKHASYLVTDKTARKWGLKQPRDPKPKISGNMIIGPDSQVRYYIPPVPNVGFRPIPQRVLENSARGDGKEVYYRVSCQSIKDENEQGIEVTTSAGRIRAHLVIDATGWEGKFVHAVNGPEDYKVVAIHGGNYRTEGFDPRFIYLLEGMKNANRSWVFPLNEHVGEAVAAHQIPSSEVRDWWAKAGEQELYRAAQIWAAGGRQINIKGGYPMAFRTDVMAKRFFEGRVIPFGEAAGLNSPFHGQLIDTLPEYADLMAQHIQAAANTGDWQSVGKNFYKDFIRNPRYMYLIHSLYRENDFNVQADGNTANTFLRQALTKVLSPEQCWQILESNEASFAVLMQLVSAEPAMIAQWVLRSVPALAAVVCSRPNLVLQLAHSLKHRAITKISESLFKTTTLSPEELALTLEGAAETHALQGGI